jgi:hypothetical protein
MRLILFVLPSAMNSYCLCKLNMLILLGIWISEFGLTSSLSLSLSLFGSTTADVVGGLCAMSTHQIKWYDFFFFFFTILTYIIVLVEI